jgi:hypothetical protein
MNDVTAAGQTLLLEAFFADQFRGWGTTLTR